jgi:hypothetical protein
MTNPKSRLLEDIKELLKSVDSKLDKLLDRQVSEDLGLGPRQKEFLKQLVNRNTRPSAPPEPQEGKLHFGPNAYRRIEI